MERLIWGLLVIIGVVNAVAVWQVGQIQVESTGWVPSTGRGILRRVFVDEDGTQHRYLVFVPYEMDTTDRLPVMLFLCGRGEYGDDGVRHLVNTFGPQLWDQKSQFPIVAVFPQCRVGNNWIPNSPDVQWALAMLDEVAEEFHTDPDRVYLTGASSGGQGAWAVADANPGRFAAVAPLCGVISSGVAERFSEYQLPIWSFVNSGDERNLVASHRAMYQALLQAGASLRYTEVAGDGHDSWSYAYRNPALYEWLLQQTRSRNATDKSRYYLIFNGKNLNGWTMEGGATWHVDNKESVVGEHAGLEHPVRLVANRAYRDFDLHLEFQLRSGDGFSLSFLDQPDDAESGGGWELQVIPNLQGSGGLFQFNDDQCLQPSDPLAQIALNPSGWNDLRVRMAEDQIVASLNGWKFVEYRDPALAERDKRIALQLQGRKPNLVAWRNIRVNEEVAVER